MIEAPFRLARRVLPHMYAREWGRVVNISSVHGLRASPYKSAYVAASTVSRGCPRPSRSTAPSTA
jgi:3-hydroxybutyrate dehydrogenase